MSDFNESSKTYSHQNPSIGSRVVPCGETDGQTDITKLIVDFCNFAPKMKFADARARGCVCVCRHKINILPTDMLFSRHVILCRFSVSDVTDLCVQTLGSYFVTKDCRQLTINYYNDAVSVDLFCLLDHGKKLFAPNYTWLIVNVYDVSSAGRAQSV